MLTFFYVTTVQPPTLGSHRSSGAIRPPVSLGFPNCTATARPGSGPPHRPGAAYGIRAHWSLQTMNVSQPFMILTGLKSTALHLIKKFLDLGLAGVSLLFVRSGGAVLRVWGPPTLGGHYFYPWLRWRLPDFSTGKLVTKYFMLAS